MEINKIDSQILQSEEEKTMKFYKSVSKRAGILKPITITQGINEFPGYLFATEKTEGTKTAYMGDLNLFRSFLKKNYPQVRYVHEIHQGIILDYQKHLMCLVQNTHLSSVTVRRKFNAIRTLFRFFEDGCHIQENPMARFTFGNKRSRANHAESADDTIKYISQEDIDRIVDSVRENCKSINKFRDIAIIQTLRFLGCRSSELRSIKWAHVDWYAKTIRIYRQKNKTFSVLPADERLLTALLDYKNSLPPSSNNFEFVFSTRESNNMSRSCLNDMFRKYVGLSGLDEKYDFNITPHTLRHSFIIHMLMNKVPPAAIIRFTGHSSVSELEPYIHLGADDLRDTLKVFKSSSSEQFILN